MSSSSEICTEVTDPDTQFNNGIKMIVSAYETQTSFLSNEITRLNKELSLRDSKIKKMDEYIPFGPFIVLALLILIKGKK